MTQQTLEPNQLPNTDGWTPVTDTWTYASATTITVPTGATSIYSIGDKFKLTANSVVLQGYIIGIADTLLTVVGDALTNHAFTNTYYSKACTPLGFPQSFNYTPSGVSATNVTKTGRYRIVGRICKVEMSFSFTGAITFTTHPGLPVTASANLLGNTLTHNVNICGHVACYDDGTAWRIMTMFPQIAPSGTVCTVIRVADIVELSATVPHTWANNDAMYISITYEI